MTSSTLIRDVADILDRDLQALADELSEVPEAHLWAPLPGIINPVGTLSHHLCGNLRYFVGALLGGDGYVRDRDDEFGARGLTREALVAEVLATRAAVADALGRLDTSRLNDLMPDPPPQHRGRTIGFFLVQLCCHLSRHRGQLNYLRRILGGGGLSERAVL
jgi:hypothetical protein